MIPAVPETRVSRTLPTAIPKMSFAVRAALAGLACAAMLVALPTAPRAMSTIDFLTSLTDEEVGRFEAWRRALSVHQDRLDKYWSRVERKRAQRRKRRRPGFSFTTDDYVLEKPPSYSGPGLGKALRRKYNAYIAAQKKDDPKKSRSTLPNVDDYLADARNVYSFTPERVSEAEFKRRYAEEALSLGLSRDQVVRVYALETGGIGTYDMQAGINPIRKTGRPISSALGYAQLLCANTIDQVRRNGRKFINKLEAMARSPRASAERQALLRSKITALKKMHATARRISDSWSAHQAFAKKRAGRGMHVLNIDADIGPMLQASKLKGVSDIAARHGRYNLTGAELEIMNLAGPSTGLEMLAPAGEKAATANFFTRRAYYVNKMVIGLDGKGLLGELNRRMDISIKTKGSREFIDAFETVKRARAARR